MTKIYGLELTLLNNKSFGASISFLALGLAVLSNTLSLSCDGSITNFEYWPVNYFTHDLSKYTVSTSFVGIAVPTKVVGMLVALALPTKVVGMQASNQIQESKWSNFH